MWTVVQKSEQKSLKQTSKLMKPTKSGYQKVYYIMRSKNKTFTQENKSKLLTKWTHKKLYQNGKKYFWYFSCFSNLLK